MTHSQDLKRIAQQEQLLQFDRFDKATAFELGVQLKQACERAGLATTIEVRLVRQTVFLYAMPGTAPDNREWARRKRNVVEMMDRSSYAVGLSAAQEGVPLEQAMGLPALDYAAHGGSFPIRVRGVGCVGAVTLSGLPQRQDHALVVEVLATLCGVELAEVSLDL